MSRDAEHIRPWATKKAGVAEPPIARFARSNRRTPTDAEQKLWPLLRQFEINGSHFRRQVVIGRFIADFACFGARLIIEVDGGQHSENARDNARTAALELEGWRVLRFWNNEVLSNPEGVLTAIAAEVGGFPGATPTPNPSPQGGGELAP